MQPVPTYEDLPVVFSTATQVEIPPPTIDSGYGEGVALPTEHFSWLNYKVTQKIDELATSTLSILGELDSYLASRGVTPSGASVTQFQTALAAQIAGASVASAAACTGNSATATSAAQCTGNSSTASKLATPRGIGGVLFDGTVDISLPGVNVAGNQNTSGNAATSTNSGNSTAWNGLLVKIVTSTVTLTTGSGNCYILHGLSSASKIVGVFGKIIAPDGTTGGLPNPLPNTSMSSEMQIDAIRILFAIHNASSYFSAGTCTVSCLIVYQP